MRTSLEAALPRLEHRRSSNGQVPVTATDSDRRRILFVINGTDFGGTESALLQLAIQMHARGHGIEVLSLKRVGRIGELLMREGIRVTSLEMGTTVTLVGCCPEVGGCRVAIPPPF